MTQEEFLEHLCRQINDPETMQEVNENLKELTKIASSNPELNTAFDWAFGGWNSCRAMSGHNFYHAPKTEDLIAAVLEEWRKR